MGCTIISRRLERVFTHTSKVVYLAIVNRHELLTGYIVLGLPRYLSNLTQVHCRDATPCQMEYRYVKFGKTLLFFSLDNDLYEVAV